jgi:hypothetical protein
MDGVSGRCFCGAIRYELRFPTEFCSHCHCEDCRRSHGAAFVTWTAVPTARFRWLAGEEKLRKHESHPGVRWGFCADCGTSLCYEGDDAPGKIYLTAANLDGPLDRAPEGHVSFEEHVSWLRFEDGLPRYRGKSEEVMK